MVKFKGHKGLESLVEYKKMRRKKIGKIISYIILGMVIYGLSYTCKHKIKPRGEIYEINLAEKW